MGTGLFPGVKWLERGIDHPPPSSAEVKGRVELYLFSLQGVMGQGLKYIKPHVFHIMGGTWTQHDVLRE